MKKLPPLNAGKMALIALPTLGYRPARTVHADGRAAAGSVPERAGSDFRTHEPRAAGTVSGNSGGSVEPVKPGKSGNLK